MKVSALLAILSGIILQKSHAELYEISVTRVIPYDSRFNENKGGFLSPNIPQPVGTFSYISGQNGPPEVTTDHLNPYLDQIFNQAALRVHLEPSRLLDIAALERVNLLNVPPIDEEKDACAFLYGGWHSPLTEPECEGLSNPILESTFSAYNQDLASGYERSHILAITNTSGGNKPIIGDFSYPLPNSRFLSSGRSNGLRRNGGHAGGLGNESPRGYVTFRRSFLSPANRLIAKTVAHEMCHAYSLNHLQEDDAGPHADLKRVDDGLMAKGASNIGLTLTAGEVADLLMSADRSGTLRLKDGNSGGTFFDTNGEEPGFGRAGVWDSTSAFWNRPSGSHKNGSQSGVWDEIKSHHVAVFQPVRGQSIGSPEHPALPSSLPIVSIVGNQTCRGIAVRQFCYFRHASNSVGSITIRREGDIPTETTSDFFTAFDTAAIVQVPLTCSEDLHKHGSGRLTLDNPNISTPKILVHGGTLELVGASYSGDVELLNDRASYLTDSGGGFASGDDNEEAGDFVCRYTTLSFRKNLSPSSNPADIQEVVNNVSGYGTIQIDGQRIFNFGESFTWDGGVRMTGRWEVGALGLKGYLKIDGEILMKDETDLVIRKNAVVAGTGSISAQTVIVEGTLFELFRQGHYGSQSIGISSVSDGPFAPFPDGPRSPAGQGRGDGEIQRLNFQQSNLELTEDCMLFVEIDATGNDRLTGQGNVSVGGSVKVEFKDGFVPHSGATFSILDFSTYSGESPFWSLPDLPDGLIWHVSDFPSTGQISIREGVDFMAWASLLGVSGNPFDDSDQDGLVNGMEFLLGADGASGDLTPLEPPKLIDGQVVWQVPFDAEVGYSSLDLEFQCSDDLVHWLPVVKTITLNADIPVYSYSEIAQERKYFRTALVSSLPPSPDSYQFQIIRYSGHRLGGDVVYVICSNTFSSLQSRYLELQVNNKIFLGSNSANYSSDSQRIDPEDDTVFVSLIDRSSGDILFAEEIPLPIASPQ